MKRFSTVFLQSALVLAGLAVLAFLIRFPLTEGRAANLDLFHIYADPFILYAYAASAAFFTGLYKAFRLLGYIGRDQVFSPASVNALKAIKYCACTLAAAIVLAGFYIRLFHAADDDPAGFLALCMITTFATLAVAAAAAVCERILQHAIDLKSENDLTI